MKKYLLMILWKMTKWLRLISNRKVHTSLKTKATSHPPCSLWWESELIPTLLMDHTDLRDYFTCGIQYWGPWGTGYGMGRWLTIMMCWLAWYTAVGVCAPGRMEGLLLGMVALGGCIWGLWKNWGGEKKIYICIFYKGQYINFTILSFLLFSTYKSLINLN